MSDHVGAAWRSYRTQVMPLDAPSVQARECRRAFYAGAQALLGALLGSLGPGVEPTAEDLRVMDEIVAELHEFTRAVQEGRA